MPTNNGMGGGLVGGGNNNMAGGGDGTGMPAGGFQVSPDAAAMPGVMNFLMNVMPQNQAGAVNQARPGGFAAPKRGPSTPPMVRGITNQVGRTMNRAVNRSVNQMLYRGLNSLRF